MCVFIEYLDTLRGITTQLKPWQFEGFILLDKSTFQRRKFIAPGYYYFFFSL